jgi:hypothetical protein
MAKGGYQSSGERLSPEEAFPGVVEFYRHCRQDRGPEELELILNHWEEITEIVATSTSVGPCRR